MVAFNWPWILLLLPLPYLLLRTLQPSSPNGIKVPPRLRNAFDNIDADNQKTRLYSQLILWIGWIALLVAVAQPYIPGDTSAYPASGRSLSVVVDLSASMERKDFILNALPANRLEVVKAVASEFIANRRGDRVGLVLFGEEAFLATPPSYDLASVINELNSSGIGMAGRTTAIGDALGLAIQSLQNDNAAEKAIVLLSDGTNNAGTTEPESAAKLASKLAIRVHTIGMASDSKKAESNNQWLASAAADLDETTLQAISNDSGGQFFRARSSDELSDIYKTIDEIERSESAAPPLVINKDVRNIPLLFLLLASLLHVLLGARRSASR